MGLGGIGRGKGTNGLYIFVAKGMLNILRITFHVFEDIVTAGERREWDDGDNKAA